MTEQEKKTLIIVLEKLTALLSKVLEDPNYDKNLLIKEAETLLGSYNYTMKTFDKSVKNIKTDEELISESGLNVRR